MDRELNLEDVGRKIQFDGQSGYLVLKGFGPERLNKDRGPLRLVTEAFNGHAPTNGSAAFWWNDTQFRFVEDEELQEFDFRRFGCNENHVRDLIKVLDKRYAKIEVTKEK